MPTYEGPGQGSGTPHRLRPQVLASWQMGNGCLQIGDLGEGSEFRRLAPSRSRPGIAHLAGGRAGALALRNRNARRAWFDAAAETIGEKGLTPHELRRTVASLVVSAGANVKAVQRMLGHKSAAMTLDVYSDLFDDDLDAVAERLDAVGRAAAVAHLLPKGKFRDLEPMTREP